MALDLDKVREQLMPRIPKETPVARPVVSAAALKGRPYWLELLRAKQYIIDAGIPPLAPEPMKIEYVVGDATEPIEADFADRAVILHCCNDLGGWGAGFVLALSAKWPYIERQYRRWWKNGETEEGTPFGLGNIQVAYAEDYIWVCNLIGQHGVRTSLNPTPIRYDAIRRGCEALADWMRVEFGPSNGVVHMPMMGTGLAGGRWEEIVPILEETFIASSIQVVVYLYDKPI